MVATAVLAADQLTKSFFVTYLAVGASRPVLPPILQVTLVYNTGAAFGLFKGQRTLFIGLSVVVIAWIGWELLTKPSRRAVALWGCALILGGAVGNLIDRLLYGAVIDFIDFRIWPVFNIADSAVTISVVFLIILLWKK